MKKIFLFLVCGGIMMAAGAQKIDRSKKPAAGPAPVISIKDPATFKLKNGITVLVVENHKLPKVTAVYNIDAGLISEGRKAGVMSLMGQMLNEGTKTKTKAQFDEAVEKMGADVSLSSSGASASALTRYFSDAFMLMAEALKEPRFTQESFDKLKSQTITGLKIEEKSAKAISSRVVSALSYGLNHPKGEFQSEETINNINLKDIQDVYAKYITPSRGYLIFVGDITAAKAKELAEKAFGKWTGKSLQLGQAAAASNPAKTEINLIDLPSAVQSEITVTNLVEIPLSSPDYFPILLANQILGGGSDGRLFMNLREKHGFTYGSYSNVGTGRFQTSFNASASVRNEKTDSAVAEILKEIERMRSTDVTAEELQNAKALFNGSFALQMENPSRLATYALNILLNGLPKDFYRTYLQKINAVTAADVKRVANKYFNHANTRVVVVGKAAAVKAPLESLGYPVHLFDKWAKPVTAETTAPTSSTTAIDGKTIIDNYINALGGKDALAKVNSMHEVYELNMQGMSLDVEFKRLAPNKESQTILMGGNPVQKEVFNGTGGYKMAGGQKKDLEGDDLKDKTAVTTLVEQQSYLTNAAFKIDSKGVEKIEGKDAYAVSITKPSGASEMQYYDVASGLLVRTESTSEANGMAITQTTDYGDYKKEGDIMIPHKVTLTISVGDNQQVLDMTLKSFKANSGVTEADFK